MSGLHLLAVVAMAALPALGTCVVATSVAHDFRVRRRVHHRGGLTLLQPRDLWADVIVAVALGFATVAIVAGAVEGLR